MRQTTIFIMALLFGALNAANAASLAKSPPCQHAFALKFSPVIRE